MENTSFPPDHTAAPRDDWKMEAIFRQKKDYWQGFLRGLLLMAVLGLGIWIYFRGKQPPTAQLSDVPAGIAVEKTAPLADLPPQKMAETAPAKMHENTAPKPVEKITENMPPSATALSFAQLAHGLFAKNGQSVAPAEHPIRRGIAFFRNGKFAAAAKIFEAVLDSSENEKISAEADYFLLLSFLAGQPKEKERYRAQLDRLLEQKNHPKYRQAGEVKKEMSKFGH